MSLWQVVTISPCQWPSSISSSTQPTFICLLPWLVNLHNYNFSNVHTYNFSNVLLGVARYNFQNYLEHVQQSQLAKKSMPRHAEQHPLRNLRRACSRLRTYTRVFSVVVSAMAQLTFTRVLLNLLEPSPPLPPPVTGSATVSTVGTLIRLYRV